MKSNFRQKVSVLLILFLGYVGFSLVFPVLPPMFLDPTYTFLPTHFSYEKRNILLGLVFASYPLGQFLGCPIFGKLSDKFGRKLILLLTLFCTALMFIATALSVYFSSFYLLLLSRFLTGLFEGNVAIGNAVMADISSTREEKTKNFGWITTFSSTGWILGPFIGGWLADSELVSWFTYATPFWMASILIFLCFFIILYIFEESVKTRIKEKLHFVGILKSLAKCVQEPVLKRIYFTNFLFFYGMFIFFIFIPALLIHRYQFGPAEIGNFEAYLSIFLCLAPLTYTFFSKRFNHRNTLAISALGLGLSFLPLIFFTSPWSIWLTCIPICYFIALGQSFGNILISDVASASTQGEALGFNQAIMFLAEALTSAIGGILIGFWIYLPFFLGVIISLIAATCILSLRHKYR
jgi:DHA1 family tetracycline resistance protein-like MFS transporter